MKGKDKKESPLDKMERKILTFEIKAFDEKEMTFTGYAAVFNNVDYGGEVVLPGAFAKSLKYRPQVRLLWKHSWTKEASPFLPVGKSLKMREDGFGLWIEGKISKTTLGLDLYQLMLDKVVTELSVGYITIQDYWEKTLRYLKELDLMEVSFVEFGMNPKAQIMQVKGATSYQNLSMAPDDTAWSASEAKKRMIEECGGKDDMDWKKYQKGFFWFDSKEAESLGAYKLPFVDIIDGEMTAVPKAIYSAAGAIQGARGGVDIPEGDVAKVKSHIEKYYKKLEKEPPWVGEGKSLDFDTNMTLSELESRPLRMMVSFYQTMDECCGKLNCDAMLPAIDALKAAMTEWISDTMDAGLMMNQQFMDRVRWSMPYFGSAVPFEIDEGMMKQIQDIEVNIKNILKS